MGGLIVRDDLQLRRIETAIARIEGSSAPERRRQDCLLEALRTEKAELLRCSSRGKRLAPRSLAAA
jgi:hypothetical protein